MLLFVMGHSTDTVRAETIADAVRRGAPPHITEVIGMREGQ